MTTAPAAYVPIPPQGPLDAEGRLVHEDDDAAQLALALANVEGELAAARLRPEDLVEIRVRTTDLARLDAVFDVLTERLHATAAVPVVTVTEVDRLAVPGMTVTLDATAARRTRRLLVVVAHPDDEAFGCGSLLAHAAARGIDSTVVCATRGELGEPSPASGLRRDELPVVRERELREACALLGVGRVEVLDYLDSGVDGQPASGSLAAADPVVLRDRVACLIDEIGPDVVVTLDASDGHRDHAAVRDATVAALDRVTRRPGRTYLFCLARSLMTELTGLDSLGTPDEDVTSVVDVSDLLDLRWRAIRAHASQVPPFDAMGAELQHGFLAVDRLRRVDPPWPGGPVETSWTTPTQTPTPTQTHATPTHEKDQSMTLEKTLEPRPVTLAETLRGLCSGGVHLPGDPGYDAARTPWNVAVDQRPAAVAVPHTAEEVVAVVRAAAAAGLRVAAQSTGHNAAPLAQGPLEDVVLVRLAEMTGVTVDPLRREARVAGGTLWQDVVGAAAEHGLAAMHGSSPDVAVAGYTLGGGLSWYARQHGLAAHQLTAVELVTADGELVRADADHHPDLFWAVRGGGGNLGVVTALELRLLPLADAYAGMLLWDREHAPAVLRAWATWTREVPDSVTTAIRVMSFPPLPELPPFLSGRQLVVIDGAVLESDDRAAELLAPLRALAPEMDTFTRMPAPGLVDIHMDPPGPTPAVSHHAMLEALPDEAVGTLLAAVGPGSTTSLLFAELRHLGGALARPDTSGALSHLRGDYALFCIAIAATPEMAARGLADARAVTEVMAPWTTGARFLSFSEEQVDTSTGYDPESWTRLQRVRSEVDPTGLFVANHRVR